MTTNDESPLHSMYIHAIFSLSSKMFTRPRQHAYDFLFLLRPWCNVISARTPPGYHLNRGTELKRSQHVRKKGQSPSGKFSSRVEKAADPLCSIAVSFSCSSDFLLFPFPCFFLPPTPRSTHSIPYFTIFISVHPVAVPFSLLLFFYSMSTHFFCRYLLPTPPPRSHFH